MRSLNWASLSHVSIFFWPNASLCIESLACLRLCASLCFMDPTASGNFHSVAFDSCLIINYGIPVSSNLCTIVIFLLYFAYDFIMHPFAYDIFLIAFAFQCFMISFVCHNKSYTHPHCKEYKLRLMIRKYLKNMENRLINNIISMWVQKLMKDMHFTCLLPSIPLTW